jgi:hypothetical protein
MIMLSRCDEGVDRRKKVEEDEEVLRSTLVPVIAVGSRRRA